MSSHNINTHTTNTGAGNTGTAAGTTSQSVGHGIKDAVKGVHGIGESIRGNVNTAVDSAFDDKAGEAKNRAVAQKGANEIDRAV